MFEIILKEDYEDHYMFRELEKADIEAKNRAEFMNQINLKRKTPRKQKKKNQRKRTPTILPASEWPDAIKVENLDLSVKKRSQKIVDQPENVISRKRNLSSHTPVRLSQAEFRAKSSLNLKNSDFHLHRASVGNLGLQKQRSGDGLLASARNLRFDATPGGVSRQSYMGRSRMSYRHGRSQSRGSSDLELKKTKVIGGHAMAIRDLNIGLLKEHKLESYGKLPQNIN